MLILIFLFAVTSLRFLALVVLGGETWAVGRVQAGICPEFKGGGVGLILKLNLEFKGGGLDIEVEYGILYRL